MKWRAWNNNNEKIVVSVSFQQQKQRREKKKRSRIKFSPNKQQHAPYPLVFSLFSSSTISQSSLSCLFHHQNISSSVDWIELAIEYLSLCFLIVYEMMIQNTNKANYNNKNIPESLFQFQSTRIFIEKLKKFEFHGENVFEEKTFSSFFPNLIDSKRKQHSLSSSIWKLSLIFQPACFAFKMFFLCLTFALGKLLQHLNWIEWFPFHLLTASKIKKCYFCLLLHLIIIIIIIILTFETNKQTSFEKEKRNETLQ